MGPASPRHGKIRTVVQVTSGNFLEMFDFFLFGIYAELYRQGFLSQREPVRFPHVGVLEFRRGLCDAADRRAGSRPLHRPDRPPQGADRHARDHGVRHRADRLRAGLRHDRPCGAALGGDRATVAGLLGRRRTRRRVGLPLGNGAAGTEGILRQLAIGEPAGRDRRRRADRLRHRQADGAGRRRGLGMAHSVRHRLPDRAAAVRAARLAAGDGGISRPRSSSELRRNRAHADRQLGSGRRRRRHGGDDDGVVLPDHRLHPLLRQERLEARRDPTAFW